MAMAMLSNWTSGRLIYFLKKNLKKTDHFKIYQFIFKSRLNFDTCLSVFAILFARICLPRVPGAGGYGSIAYNKKGNTHTHTNVTCFLIFASLN